MPTTSGEVGAGGARLRIGLSAFMSETWGDLFRQTAPDAEYVTLDTDGQWRGDPANLDAFFLSEDFYTQPVALQALIELMETSPPRWFQTASTGVDHYIYELVLRAGHTLTNAPGVHAGPIAEYVFAHILSRAKHLPRHAEQARQRIWRNIDSIELAGQTIGIVGYGGIGSAIARRARAFEMRTIATKRRPPNDPALDQHLPPDRLPELLRESDYVVLSVPLTDETVDMMGAEQFAQMKPDAMLINVGRGRLIDHEALRVALESEQLAAAVLDVAPHEPADADSVVWTLPRTTITPHDSCAVPSALRRTTQYFVTNLEHLVRGEELEWQVDATQLSLATHGLV